MYVHLLERGKMLLKDLTKLYYGEETELRVASLKKVSILSKSVDEWCLDCQKFAPKLDKTQRTDIQTMLLKIVDIIEYLEKKLQAKLDEERESIKSEVKRAVRSYTKIKSK